MLKLFRKKGVVKAVLWMLLILIIPAFVMWGSGKFLRERGDGPDYAGTIDGKKVSFENFFDNMSASRSQLILNYWGRPEILRSLLGNKALLARFAWQRLLFLKEARARNIKVSDQEVIQYVTSHPLFVKNGAFDKKLYEYILKYNFGLNARGFEEFIREFLTIVKLQNEITGDVTVTDEEVLEEYKRAKERVQVKYIFVENISFAEKIDIGQEEIGDYYKKNKGLFTVPDMVDVSYIVFPYGAYKDDMAAIRKARDFAVKAIENPSIFEKLALAADLEVHETGPFQYRKLPEAIGNIEAFRSAAFGLPEGRVSDVIIPADQARSECYVIKIINKIPPRPAQLDEAKAEIVDALIEERSREMSGRYADELYASLTKLTKGEGLSLEEAAEKLAAPFTESDPFLRNDLIVEGLGTAEKVWDAAVELEKGELSEPIEVANGFCIVTPVAFEPFKQEDFEKEKEEFTKLVLEKKKNSRLDEWFRKTSARSELMINLEDIERYR